MEFIHTGNNNMERKYKIGIVGQGFVGNAVKMGMEHAFNIETYDIIEEKSTCKSVSDLLTKINLVFVCVPTPMKKTGECDISIVETILQEANEWGLNHIDQKPLIILKSTVPVGTCTYLQNKYNNIILVFNPEFLTEANAVDDFKNQKQIIFGLNRSEEELPEIAEVILALCKPTLPNAIICLNSYEEAEMVKYISNCFLATKVTFANQIHDLCEAAGIDYSNLLYNIEQDPRLGSTHWKVPGPDGDRGYGGHCFPKDMAAIAFRGDQLGVNLSLIKEAIRYNDSIRTDRNWESMKGRAVSDD